MRHAAKVISTIFSARLQMSLKNRVPVFISLLNTALLGLSVYVVIEVFFHNVSTISGWDKKQCIVLYGSFIAIRSFVQMIVLPNCEATSRLISTKGIDGYLLRPADSQLVLAFSEVRIWNIFGIILGIGLMVRGAFVTDDLGLVTLGAYAGMLLIACVIVYALWFVVMSLAFWTKKTSNISHLLFMFLTTGRFPSAAYPEWMQVIIIAVIPIFFIIEVPAQSVLGLTESTTILGGLAVAALFLAISRVLWLCGVQKYLTEGS
jgi:ABC-2 type transport system permease protein